MDAHVFVLFGLLSSKQSLTPRCVCEDYAMVLHWYGCFVKWAEWSVKRGMGDMGSRPVSLTSFERSQPSSEGKEP
ncbi:unnamed protein product [Boreogadus saida]